MLPSLLFMVDEELVLYHNFLCYPYLFLQYSYIIIFAQINIYFEPYCTCALLFTTGIVVYYDCISSVFPEVNTL